MSGNQEPVQQTVPARMILHQEGFIAVIAVIGLSLRESGLAAGLAPRGSLVWSLAGGAGVGLACCVVLWLVRGLPPLADLERWQRRMVAGWTATDVLAVAAFSGLAEEALVRAFMQPLVGLVPAALIFAVLHVVPDRSMWLWPIIALVLGLLLGWIFERGGYPAAAAAHTVINGVALVRLRKGSTA
jgi:membrane protease YdiL (CAAX protease family)